VKEGLVIPILSSYTQQDAFTQSKDSLVSLQGWSNAPPPPSTEIKQLKGLRLSKSQKLQIIGQFYLSVECKKVCYEVGQKKKYVHF
jgi:hypothetical protein